ncbi:ketoacyl-ACP synthase III family protein [Micromonospora sp. NPDC050980]|uniref:ketoacyl-ACP synthase III family protein n=1 Tax=Micromonospora sp. NPDC050980 TaxID=3155161 RepID=UPI0033FB09E7
MRFDDIHIAGYGSELPPAVTAAEAAGQGLCDRALAAQNAMEAVTVSTDLAGPELAVRAGRAALARAGAAGESVELLLHSALYYQGHDMWAPASYVLRHTVGDRCPAIDVRQTSNGGMASLALAASFLTGRQVGDAALLTCGDRFCPPGIDRWRSDPGTVFADGGAAVVVARGTGFARVRSLVLHSDSSLERMHRGDDPFSPGPMTIRSPLDVRHTTRAFLRAEGASFAVGRMAAGQRAVVKTALAEAGLELADVARFVLPNFGRRRMETSFFQPFELDPERTTWPWGRGVGHLGAGDQFAGLTHLLTAGELRAGDVCALLGVGGGFSWSCAIVELTADPPAA